MATFNLTHSNPSTLILNGIPGLESAHIWISIPFCMFYILSLLGNFMVIFVISKEQTLHKPMYLLLGMLALTDISLSTSIMPKALGIFWFNFKDITVEGCLTQIFFFNAAGAMHSAILLTMAFDRYIAICYPLRYTTILTNARIAQLGLFGLIRAVFLVLPLPLILWRLPFCANHIIPHTYCEFMALGKMSCTDTLVNWIYSLIIDLGIIVPDVALISLSYGLILRATLRISSRKAHRKAFNTCSTHLCVMLMTYTFCLLSVLSHRFGESIPAHTHILLANLYVVVPPMLNPIIYGVRNQKLRDNMRKQISSGVPDAGLMWLKPRMFPSEPQRYFSQAAHG